jgi:hypothetical protein
MPHSPDDFRPTPEQRRREIASILARGILHLRSMLPVRSVSGGGLRVVYLDEKGKSDNMRLWRRLLAGRTRIASRRGFGATVRIAFTARG